MNARRRPNMRRLVDNTVALVRAGELSVELAASKLHENGVPVAVIGRVLGMAVAAGPADAAAASAAAQAATATTDAEALA